MKSFLSLIAADMLAHFSNDMRDVTVVFPGKRAGMFLSRELAVLSKIGRASCRERVLW